MRVDDVLPRTTLLRMLAVLVLVLAPHALRLPWWESVAVAASLLWRYAALQRGWPLPGMAVRVILTVSAFIAVYLSFGRINGQHSGTALLVLMTGFKLLEMRSRRDVMVVVFLLYFLLLTHFLFSQEIWTLLWMLSSAVMITALLIEIHHREPLLPFRETLRLSLRLTGQALPVMLVIFVLFPRIPGPLWGLPADAGASRSGIPDSMSPGDIADLILSEAVAFRVQFEGTPPSQRDLYWRGPVFDFYDGRKWEIGFRRNDAPTPDMRFEGAALPYEMVLEPTRTHWLFGLELTDTAALPPETRVNSDAQLVARKRVTERRLYRAVARTDFQLEPDGLSRWQEASNLRLPDDVAPGARALVSGWRDDGLDDPAMIERALRYFRQEPFRYTLQPPLLGAQPVDEFLFQTRAGFCEHYASSFVVMMRLAGIPSRVVVGYQGGEPNGVGGYWVVRQSDAHAWTEVWLDGVGWQRVDPTAAVSPDRIEQGFSESIAGGGGGDPDFWDRGEGLWTATVARWDWLNAKWNRWVLAYGPEVQRDVLSRLGIDDWTEMVLWLTAGVTGLLALISLQLLRGLRPPRPADAASREWQRLQRHLARQGLHQQAHEGPRDFIRRLCAQRPQQAALLTAAGNAYEQLRYLQAPDADGLQRLREAVNALLKAPADRSGAGPA